MTNGIIVFIAQRNVIEVVYECWVVLSKCGIVDFSI